MLGVVREKAAFRARRFLDQLSADEKATSRRRRFLDQLSDAFQMWNMFHIYPFSRLD